MTSRKLAKIAMRFGNSPRVIFDVVLQWALVQNYLLVISSRRRPKDPIMGIIARPSDFPEIEDLSSGKVEENSD